MSDPFSINGGSVVALKGKDCVGIACDLRLGQQAMTVSTDFPKIFPMGEKVFLGLAGLATDVQTMSSTPYDVAYVRNELFRFKTNMYRLREERSIEPKTLAHLVSSSLYERRFTPYFVNPVVAGINSKTNEPYICGFDNIGCMDLSDSFIVAGTATDQLYGMLEALYEPDLGPEDLFETMSQAFLNAVDRDAISGWGVVCYVITKDQCIKRYLKGRMD